MAQRPPYPPTWQGYMSESILDPPEHTIAADDDLSFAVPAFSRGEEFTPGPFQKGFTPAAYDAVGWEERDEDDFEDGLFTHWADESNLVETTQWFDQPPLYHNPMIPREWESGDTYGMNTRPIAFADFRDPRAQQYVHERACGPIARRRVSCMAQAQTNPYKSCIRWLDAEARCFQSIFCKKELVEYEQCTEGGDPALASACTEYQGALNSCMAKIEMMWSEQKQSWWYPDDDLDLDPEPGGLDGRDFDNKKLTQFEGYPGRPGMVNDTYMQENSSEDEDEMADESDTEAGEWGVDEVDYDMEFDEFDEAHENFEPYDDEGPEMAAIESEMDGDDGEDLEDEFDGDTSDTAAFSDLHLPHGDMAELNFFSQFPAKRNFERRIDDAETFDPDTPGSQYFPIPVREPEGSWEEEQYEIKQARKELELAAWRNHGQENFGNVYVQRSVK